MTRNAVLGVLLVVFGVAGLVVGIVRLAPEADGGDWLLALAGAAAGCAVFAVTLRAGRRGSPPWLKWLLVPGLVAALFLDRLSERWQLALLVSGAAYVAAFLGTVVLRIARLPRGG